MYDYLHMYLKSLGNYIYNIHLSLYMYNIYLSQDKQFINYN